MQLVALFTSLCKALALYFELKNRSFYNDIVEKHYKRKKELINEIEQLRNNPNSRNTSAADILLLVLEQENKRFDDISTFYNNFGKGSDDTNKRG
jgi:hypothetical protein